MVISDRNTVGNWSEVYGRFSPIALRSEYGRRYTVYSRWSFPIGIRPDICQKFTAGFHRSLYGRNTARTIFMISIFPKMPEEKYFRKKCSVLVHNILSFTKYLIKLQNQIYQKHSVTRSNGAEWAGISLARISDSQMTPQLHSSTANQRSHYKFQGIQIEKPLLFQQNEHLKWITFENGIIFIVRKTRPTACVLFELEQKISLAVWIGNK